MSAVEQARAATFWCLDCERACSRCASCESALNALIAAVRAEESQRWREGVEAGYVADGWHLPECGRAKHGNYYCGCGRLGVREAHNAALAAVAARMEAK